MAKEIERRLGLQAAGSMLPFTVIDADGRIAGMTTYMNVDTPNRRVEIGSTWYAKRVQRSALNTQCKLLLLTHAFETSTASRSSSAPISSTIRAGARSSGSARSRTASCAATRLRRTAPCATPSSSASLPREWPTVKAHLNFQLNDRPRAELLGDFERSVNRFVLNGRQDDARSKKRRR